MELAALKNEDNERLLAHLEHSLGSVILSALNDPKVNEVILNPDGKVWVYRFGRPQSYETDLTPQEGETIISLVASSLKITANRSNTSVAGEFPIGKHRFQGQLPPNTTNPMFSIRKKAEKIFTLDDYVTSGTITEEALKIIKELIVSRKNIIIAGGTGTGKTTLANAIIHALSELCANDRLLLLEDTYELQSKNDNTARLKATEEFPMESQLKDTLRLRPDRIIVGEVRDGAALRLLEAWNTGHPGGISTLHANSALDTLNRLETLVQYKVDKPLHGVIASAVDVIIYITHADTKSCRRVTEILKISGYNHTTQTYEKEYLYHEPQN
ncbi:P-type conjugative transfer ATPase TrbB [Halodesulfovibrio sp.]|jgi:type IV secretion system protein VirB11|uniref:P-type conjugative transfer ATPase TrbB n=1 Tax=Halodesulfovibrio sp. TaxID=1912772 RepID=UPI0025E62362|nr:P-type conjugative transfer ATPase TrbB [Halodesulfovibrio sp.]MCT4533745.1 P-type conjugative transfer ATPase TrbB [Halodesulfovibrio sp.]